MHVDVPVEQSSRLLNHGPTVLVSAAHAGRRNVMAAAWAMPLDYDKVAVVVDKSTFTRGLIESSGRFAINVPCRAQADLVFTLGNTTGRDVDKFQRYGVAASDGAATGLPLLQGCVAWLECALLSEPHNQGVYDLFLGQVLAAQADARVFVGGRWQWAPEHDTLRTLHHLGGGHFVSVADPTQAQMLPG